MKVYGGLLMRKGKQVRVIAAVRSQKRFAELAGLSLNETRNYYAETGNDQELKAAFAKPDTLLWTGSQFAHSASEYREWKKK